VRPRGGESYESSVNVKNMISFFFKWKGEKKLGMRLVWEDVW